MAVALHPFSAQVKEESLPKRFTFPFCYEPHPLCVAAAGEVRRYVEQCEAWRKELQMGKMFGVLVVKTPTSAQDGGGVSFLAAFSGTLGGKTRQDFFVPPVYDLMAPGCYFQEEEAAISSINQQIREIEKNLTPSPLREEMQTALSSFKEQMQRNKAERDQLRQTLSAEELTQQEAKLIRQSQYEKAELRRLKQAWEQRVFEDEASLREQQEELQRLQRERHERSSALQQWLFQQYSFLNASGERRSLTDLFSPAVPPAGAGECCAPKLLQAAYTEGLQPLCMAEFWLGASPVNEVRTEGHFYPACNGKCRPILNHMLGGLDVDPNPLLSANERLLSRLHIIYNDGEMAVVSKPSGMLSVLGKDDLPNVKDAILSAIPSARGPLIVHRLDMDTSGLMLIALTEEKYHELQELFLERRVHKVYHALLEHEMPEGQEGDICLPLRPDYDDRPRQMVDEEHGKPALTHYRVLGNKGGHALLELRPITGRTHQLRVHCAHALGLANPIVGDRLYGKPAERLMLHAYSITLNGKTFVDEEDIS